MVVLLIFSELCYMQLSITLHATFHSRYAIFFTMVRVLLFHIVLQF